MSDKPAYVDPFFPDKPVNDPTRFEGRASQVQMVVDSLHSTRADNPRNVVITGDRGIGKSSLLLQTMRLAEGDNRLTERLEVEHRGPPFSFVVAWHDADTGQTPWDIAEGLLEELQTAFTAELKRWDFKINIGNLIELRREHEREPGSVSALARAFSRELAVIATRLVDEGHDGMILFIDELDRVAPNSGVASFFKLVTERLNREDVTSVAFFCAGITGAVQSLEEDHASIYRTFVDVLIPRLELSETRSILESGFTRAGFTYDGRIAKNVHELAAGFPEPVHLLGSTLLQESETDHLTMADLERAKQKMVSVVRRNKLLALLQTAGSGKYQQILLAMANHEGPHVPVSFISREIGFEQNQYSTNMGTLIDREIIHRVDRGVYSFVDPLLKTYIERFGIITSEADEESFETD